MAELELRDLGEQGLLAQLGALRTANANGGDLWGADSALLGEINGTRIVWSIDNASYPPIMRTLTGEDSFYEWGWLSAIASISDVAASGGTYFGSEARLTVPVGFLEPEAERLMVNQILAGHLHAVSRFGGGLTADFVVERGDMFKQMSTAFGSLPSRRQFVGRRGASAGQAVCVAGNFGEFWPSVFAVREGIDSLRNDAFLTHPTPMTGVGPAIANYVTAMTDCSDGIADVLRNIARESNVGMELDVASIAYPDRARAMAAHFKVEPAAMAMSWGGWELVFTAPLEYVDAIKLICESLRTPFYVLGETTNASGIYVTGERGRGLLEGFDSQHFKPSARKGADGWASVFNEVSSGQFYRTGNDLIL